MGSFRLSVRVQRVGDFWELALTCDKNVRSLPSIRRKDGMAPTNSQYNCAVSAMIAKVTTILSAAVLFMVAPLYAQESVCDLFSRLASADTRQLVVTGDLIISKDVAVLGAADCDNRYTSRLKGGFDISYQWPVALSLRPSPNLSPALLRQFQEAGVEADRLRLAGKTVSASGSFSGRIRIEASGGSPAELIFDSFEKLNVEALQDPSTLTVISICDLFQNLAAWRGKRVAVRGNIVSTFEGSWITGSCEVGFVTSGYRWPVSLNYGIPAYYSSKTAKLYEPKWPSLANGEGLSQQRSHAIWTATFVGFLRMRSEYTVSHLPNGVYVTNGFGHLNGAAAELIVETILNPEVAPPQPMTQKAITP